MKIDIYTLLGMIKDNKPPKKIVYENCIYEYVDREEDYWDKNNIGLFDEYVISNILNDEVEILETTITYKQNENIKEKIIKLQSEIDILENQISKLHNEAHSLRDSNSYMKKKLKELMTIIK